LENDNGFLMKMYEINDDTNPSWKLGGDTFQVVKRRLKMFEKLLSK